LCQSFQLPLRALHPLLVKLQRVCFSLYMRGFLHRKAEQR
jgi:hypothetical protein